MNSPQKKKKPDTRNSKKNAFKRNTQLTNMENKVHEWKEPENPKNIPRMDRSRKMPQRKCTWDNIRGGASNIYRRQASKQMCKSKRIQ